MGIKDEMLKEMKRRDGWQAALGDAIPLDASYEKRQATREPTLSGDVLVPLSQALVSSLAGAILGGLAFRTLTAVGVAGALTFCGAWLLLLVGNRQLLYSLERLTRHDLDDDGQVGTPPADRLVPVFYNKKRGNIDTPTLPEIDEGDREIRLLPSKRKMPKREVWDYMQAAFMSGQWSRAGCKSSNVNTKEWADIRGFVRTYYPDVWETTDRPTLDWFVQQLQHPLTD